MADQAHQSDCFRLPQNSDEVIERMKDYVKAFVTIYLKRLQDYNDRLVNRVRKNGKLCNLMGELTGTMSGGHEVLSDVVKASSMVGLSVVQWGAGAVGSSFNRTEVKKLLKVLNYFNKKPEEMRRILIRSAMDVFESYEAQFVRITSDDSWERAMYKLAEDAVDRSLSYFRCNRQETFSFQNVKKGIVTGTSRTYSHFSTGIPKFQSGHTVKNESDEWNTSDMYQKTGIVYKNYLYYYIDEKGAKEFGYRLRLDFDDVNSYSQGYVSNTQPYMYLLNLDEDKKNELELSLLGEVQAENEKILEKLEQIIKETMEIRERVERMEEEKSSQATTDILIQIRPPLKTFSGRTQQLKDINKILLDGNQILVICGLSGVGKTELTLKYLDEFWDNFNGNILWINVQGEETMRNSMYGPATKMGLNMLDKSQREKRLNLILHEIYEYFVNRKLKSLFIFDNADRYESIKAFLPNFRKGAIVPQIIIISTNSEWGDDRHNMKVYRLKNFEMEESIQFFKKALEIKSDSEDHDIKLLAKAQDNFPLTLHEAVSYIRQERNKIGKENFSVTSYFKLYEDNAKDLLDSNILEKYNDEYDKNSYTALHLSLKKIESEKALEILNILAYFSSDTIGKGLILKLPEKDDYPSIIQLLENYSIITRHYDGITIHGLTQQILRIDMQDPENTEKEKEHLVKALNLLKTVMTDRETAKMYSSHIISVWNYASKYYELIKQFIVDDLDATHSKFIHFIAERCDKEIFQRIISKITQACPEKLEVIAKVRDNDGWTPLHLAAKNGQYEIVETLIDKAEIDAETGFKFTALHLAALNCYPEIVRLLIKNNANLNIRNHHGYTPLHFAVKKNDLKTVQYILSQPVGIQTLQVGDNKGLQPLSVAVRFADFNIVNFLIDKGAKVDVSSRFISGSSSLYFAAERADLPIMELILDKTKFVHVLDDKGYTPLHFAVKKQQYHVSKLLLEHGVDINATTIYGLTPLHFAVKHTKKISPDIKFVDLLLNNKNVNVNIQNVEGFTPLHLAVESTEKDIISRLLTRPELDVNLKTSKGNTPLHLAAEKGNFEIVEMLMNKGASNDYENAHGKRPSDVTRNKSVCDYILHHQSKS